ncbi:MAG: RNA polymerase sigma factor [Chloroflexota bacterium]
MIRNIGMRTVSLVDRRVARRQDVLVDGNLNIDRLIAASDFGQPVSDVPEQSDSDLVAACRNGRPGAWDQIVRRYAKLVYAVARRYGLNEDEVADVFQTVCLELWEHLDSVRDATVLRRWLVVVASRKAWQVRKSRDRWITGVTEESAEPLVSALSLSPEEVAVAHSDAEQMRLVLERLAPRDRELIWYLFFDPSSPSYDVIAQRLGVSPETVGSLRTRCLRRLRWVLAEHSE